MRTIHHLEKQAVLGYETQKDTKNLYTKISLQLSYGSYFTAVYLTFSKADLRSWSYFYIWLGVVRQDILQAALAWLKSNEFDQVIIIRKIID